MSDTCPIHDIIMIEKEGQFGTFWSHRIVDPGYPSGYCNGKPPKSSGYGGGGYQAAKQVRDSIVSPIETREPIPQRDYNAENTGKCRTGIVAALIKHSGFEALEKIANDKDVKDLINKVAGFDMTGR